MGDCIYCGKSAGLFHHVHADCEAKHTTALKDITLVVSDAASGQSSMETALASIAADDEGGFVNRVDALKAAKAGWCLAANTATESGTITKERETQLVGAMQSFGLDWSDLRYQTAGIRFLQAQILRRINDNESEMPAGFKIETSILAPASEKRFWSEDNVKFYEDRTHHHTAGTSHGVSIRVMRGVYYHAGAHKGTSVTTHGFELIDTGSLLITNKKIYFSGASKAFSVALAKVLSVEPFEDGVRIQRDGLSAKPQAFETVDGVFMANMIQSLCSKLT